jgi:hypothetical protein
MAEQWNEFARRVLPVNISPIQKQEMRLAFYAGWDLADAAKAVKQGRA